MRVLVALPSGARSEETLDANPSWTSHDLRSAIQHVAHERLGQALVAILRFADGGSISMDPPQSLVTLGLGGSEACVHCELVAVPRVQRCEPPYGPVAGGTLLTLRGSGFLVSSGFSNSNENAGARLSFGAGCTVPCWRLSDEELLCRTPTHAPGVVSVTLLGCEAAGSSTGAATFEFASEGRICDLIFATANAHCPLHIGDATSRPPLPSHRR